MSGRWHRQHVRSAAAAMSSSACVRSLATFAVPFAIAAAPLSYPLACKCHSEYLPRASSAVQAVQGLSLLQQPYPVMYTPEALL